MWILKGPKDEVYYLLPGKHVVGRKNCNLILDNDQSISRVHAVIEVTHLQSNWGNPTEKPVVEVSDVGSKYGTTLNTGTHTVKMEKNDGHNLKEGYVIHFGLQFSKWQLTYEPLIVVVSSLSKAEKQKIRILIGELGGHVVSDWHPHTSHLTMENVTMTVKAISALAHAKPIVTPQYWHSFQTAINSKTDLPKCEDYVPPIGESVLNEHKVSFHANFKRNSLFKGKTFYFFSEPQFKDHGCMVQAAGGVPKLVRAVMHTQMIQFVEPDAVAMQLLSSNSQTLTFSQTPEAFTEVCEFLKSHGKRLIPASEIGLAVLHCSVEKYCNPDFNFSSMLLRNSSDSQPAVPERILATETQENSVPTQRIIGDRKVIPDSGNVPKLVQSLNASGSLSDPGTNSKHEILQDSQPERLNATQLREDTLQLQLPGPSNRNTPDHRSKRLRVIDESEDEVEVLTPRKFPKDIANARKKKLDVGTEKEFNSNTETYTSLASNSRVSRVSSKTSHYDDSDDPDQLFADFKESQPSTKPFSFACPESPDMDADDLFADFQDDVKTSSAQKQIMSHKSTQSSVTSTIPMSPACKRVLSDDESGPPEKRFAKLEVSRQHDAEEYGEEIEFVSTTEVKKEDQSFHVKSSCNVTVVFKTLIVSKGKNTCAASSQAPVNTGIVNYKKFKKVNPLSMSIIPRIIGGRDLQPYQSFGGNNSDLSGINDVEESEDEEGPNTLWGTITQKNNWKLNRSRKL